MFSIEDESKNEGAGRNNNIWKKEFSAIKSVSHCYFRGQRTKKTKRSTKTGMVKKKVWCSLWLHKQWTNTLIQFYVYLTAQWQKRSRENEQTISYGTRVSPSFWYRRLIDSMDQKTGRCRWLTDILFSSLLAPSVSLWSLLQLMMRSFAQQLIFRVVLMVVSTLIK